MFIRRYTDMPSLEQLQEIEHVALIERDPVGSPAGVAVGMVTLVGEVPNDRGEPLRPRMVLSESHLRSLYGDPSPFIGDAAGGYEGNLHVHAAGMAHLWPAIVIPVDAAAKDGDFYQYLTVARPPKGFARVTAKAPTGYSDHGEPAYPDLAPGDQIVVEIDGGAPQTGTIAAVAAHADSPGTGPWDLSGDPSLTIDVDQTGGQQIDLDSSRFSGSGGDAATAAEVAAQINEQLVGGRATVAAGKLRVESDTLGSDSAVTVFDFGAGAVLGYAGAEATPPEGSCNVADVSQVRVWEIEHLLTALPGLAAHVTYDGRQLFIESPTAGAGGSVEVTAGTTATDVFAVGLVTGSTGELPVGVLRGGSRVLDPAGRTWLLAADTPWSPTDTTKQVRVRPGPSTSQSGASGAWTLTDVPEWDATFTASAVSEIDPPSGDAMDTRYDDALDVAADPSDLYASLGSFLVACRHTQAVAASATEAAVARSSSGRGMLAFVSPPDSIDFDEAIGDSGAGVGSALTGGRHERRVYAFGGRQARVRLGGKTSVVTLTADTAMAALQARLKPEESIGAASELNRHILGLGPQAQFGKDTEKAYAALKKFGIACFRRTALGYLVQSAVTSSLVAGRESIQRRTFKDYIGDSIAAIAIGFKDKPATDRRRRDLKMRVELFLANLQAAGRLGKERDAYKVVDMTTDELRRANVVQHSVTVDAPSLMGTIAFVLRIEPGALSVEEVELAMAA